MTEYELETVIPTAVFTANVSSLDNQPQFNMSLVFSEPVVDFTASDIVVTQVPVLSTQAVLTLVSRIMSMNHIN